MSSQTSLVARKCRLQSWAMQIKDCQNRPEDMTVDEWCMQNNITKANYYYRLKCVRQACLDSMESTPAFVELPVREGNTFNESTTSATAVAVIRGENGLTIELQENASAEFIKKLIGACAYAQ
ncbi:MAG: IS66 family insertion sequence element accessory protein TnpB [Lachnospiraceae bacterium]|nr:IS66 family insertion sequence element accessory protein TnpB [Lachnospiraceae bacterium]